MNTLAIGLTGWWSNFFFWLQRSIAMIRRRLAGTPGMTFWQGHWRDWKKFADAIIAMPKHKRPKKIIAIGHSYGASATTLFAAELAKHGIVVDLLISEDQGLDSRVIVDLPIGANVRHVIEYWVALERLEFSPAFKGEREFHNVRHLPGGHIDTFTNPKMVDRVVSRILEAHNR